MNFSENKTIRIKFLKLAMLPLAILFFVCLTNSVSAQLTEADFDNLLPTLLEPLKNASISDKLLVKGFASGFLSEKNVNSEEINQILSDIDILFDKTVLDNEKSGAWNNIISILDKNNINKIEVLSGLSETINNKSSVIPLPASTEPTSLKDRVMSLSSEIDASNSAPSIIPGASALEKGNIEEIIKSQIIKQPPKTSQQISIPSIPDFSQIYQPQTKGFAAPERTTLIPTAGDLNNLLAASIILDVPSAALPKQNMFASAKAKNFNPNEAIFTWYLDGQAEKSGYGAVNFAFESPKKQGLHKIKTRATYKGNVFESEKDFWILDIALDFSADTFTPKEYQGKILPTKNSLVRAAAAPLFPKDIDVSLLYFKWSLDLETQVQKSGVNRNEFEFLATKTSGDFYILTVEISDLAQNIKIAKSITIPVVAPEIVLYESESNRTVLLEKRTIKDFFNAVRGNEFVFSATPFFFNAKKLEDLEYSWTLNGEELSPDTTDNPHILKVQIDQNSAANNSVPLSVTVSSKDERNFMERDFKSITINIR